MSVDLPIVLLIGVVALVVAAIVAQRAGEHADRTAGRRQPARATRRGPLGAVADLLDQSVAAYGIRRRLGRSTRTNSQRRADEAQAAQVAYAEEIRQHRTGPPPSQPTHLIVSGSAGRARPIAPAPAQRSSTLANELLVAAIGLLLVIGLVIAIAPRGTGGVLSATGVAGSAAAPRAAPTLP